MRQREVRYAPIPRLPCPCLGDPMTLTQLRSFLEVCRARNFTAAAANLYVSQSSLSYAISGHT